MTILSLQHAFLAVPLEAPRLLNDFRPIVTLYRLGAIIYGPIPGDKNNYSKHALHFHRCSRSEDTIMEVGYWRVVSDDIKVVFVMGKTSCAPSRCYGNAVKGIYCEKSFKKQ